MASEINDREISIDEITPKFGSFIARQAKREVDKGNEVTLKEITLTVRVKHRQSNGNQSSTRYEFTYWADNGHDGEGTVKLTAFERPNANTNRVGLATLVPAIARADRAVQECLEHIDAAEAFDVVPVTEQFVNAATDDDVQFFDRIGEEDRISEEAEG